MGGVETKWTANVLQREGEIETCTAAKVGIRREGNFYWSSLRDSFYTNFFFFLFITRVQKMPDKIAKGKI